MSVLKIILPNGASRYVTGIFKNDVSYSIYSTNALECTDDNVDGLTRYLATIENLIEADYE